MPTTLILTRSDVAASLDMAACIGAVERAFRLHAEGSTLAPGVLSVPATGGGFHIKAAGLRGERSYFAAKTNGNFHGNPELGLPRIQGTLVLCDGANGTPLALMDANEITRLRTAAATAVAARRLARPDARVATICGCGIQGRAQLEALAQVTALDRVFAYDTDPHRAAAFARDLAASPGMAAIAFVATADLPAAVAASAIVVTATPARAFVLEDSWISPGTFVAAVGADHPDKQEIEPALLARGRVVVDLMDQCAAMGDLHHALASGVMTTADVHAELHEVVAGTRPGRLRAEEIFVFDSTGTALQDVAAAAAAYERAREIGVGLAVRLTE